jgi:hypothetical protein
VEKSLGEVEKSLGEVEKSLGEVEKFGGGKVQQSSSRPPQKVRA